jgi:hypothetical protein
LQGRLGAPEALGPDQLHNTSCTGGVGTEQAAGYDGEPMLRRLFTILSAVSLALCVATIVLWVRSYWRVHQYERYDAQFDETPIAVRETSIAITKGGFLILFSATTS